MNKNERIGFRLFSAISVFSLVLLGILSALPEKPLYIKAQKIFTSDEAGVLEGGALMIEGAKIVKLEKRAKPPQNARVLDFKDKVVVPGFIDAHSQIGFHEEDFNVKTEPPAPWAFSPWSVAKKPLPPPLIEARFGAAEAVYYGDDCFMKFLAEGITSTAIFIPTNNLVGGTSCAVKLGARTHSEFILKETLGGEFALAGTENVMERYGDLKKIFLDAIEYKKKFEKYQKDLKAYQEKKTEVVTAKPAEEPKEPKKDENQEVILQILDRKIPAFIRASRINEIEAALKLRTEFKIDAVLVGGQEAYKLADVLSREKIPVIAGPESVYILRGEKIGYLKDLVNKGVPVGFSSQSGVGALFLLFQLTYAIQSGLTEGEALAILTINAARTLGISDQVGSLHEGKDADFLVLSGEPFRMNTKVEKVFVNGRQVYSSGEEGRR